MHLTTYFYGMLYLILLVVGCMTAAAQTDVLMMQREGAKHRRDRDAYFDQLHVMPQGMDWRLVQEAVRDARASERARRNGEAMPQRSPWTEVGSVNQAGRTWAIEVDTTNGRCWVGGDGGTVWVGDIEGTFWTCLNDDRRIQTPRLIKNVNLGNDRERLVVVSSAPRVWYRDGDGVWKESEGLANMQRWGWFDHAVSRVINGRLEIVAMGAEWDYGSDWRAKGTLYHSIDSGKSFRHVGFFEGNRALWGDGRNNVVFMANDTTYVMDADGALQAIDTGWPWPKNGSFILAGVQGDWLAAHTLDGKTTMYHSSDAMTWTQRGQLGFGPFSGQSIGSTISEPRSWFFGGVNVMRSTDQGATWKLVNEWWEYYGDPAGKLHADIPGFRCFTMKDGREISFISTDGGLYRSFDGLATVENISLYSLNVSQYYSVYTNRDNVQVISAGSQDQGFQRSTVENDEPREFSQLISGDYAQIVSNDEGKSLFTVYPGFTMYIPNAEDGWGPISMDFPHSGHLWLPPLAAEPGANAEVWLGGGTREANGVGAKLYRYRSDGRALIIDSIAFDFGLGESDVRITTHGFAPSDSRYRYVVTSKGNVFATADAGTTWTQHKRPEWVSEHYFSGNCMVVHPKDPRTLYLAGSGYQKSGVVVSTDGGMTFAECIGLPPCLVLDIDIAPDGKTVYAATDNGAFAYDVELGRWKDLTELGGPDQTYWSVDFVPQLNIARFGTYGRGIWDYAHGSAVSVDEPTKPSFEMLDVKSVMTPTGPRLMVAYADDQPLHYTWFDIDGRLVGTGSATPTHARMVIVRQGRRIGSAVIPR